MSKIKIHKDYRMKPIIQIINIIRTQISYMLSKLDKYINYNSSFKFAIFLLLLYIKKGLTENRTRIKGIRILCANRYTIRPIKIIIF